MIPLYAAEYIFPATDGMPEHTYTLYAHASGSKVRYLQTIYLSQIHLLNRLNWQAYSHFLMDSSCRAIQIWRTRVI